MMRGALQFRTLDVTAKRMSSHQKRGRCAPACEGNSPTTGADGLAANPHIVLAIAFPSAALNSGI